MQGQGQSHILRAGRDPCLRGVGRGPQSLEHTGSVRQSWPVWDALA